MAVQLKQPKQLNKGETMTEAETPHRPWGFYEVLADEMQSSIHALSMTCLTPEEYEDDD